MAMELSQFLLIQLAELLKRELFKKFENKSDFSPSAKFVIMNSCTTNPSEYSVAVLK